jgi:hypothetical protein
MEPDYRRKIAHFRITMQHNLVLVPSKGPEDVLLVRLNLICSLQDTKSIIRMTRKDDMIVNKFIVVLGYYFKFLASSCCFCHRRDTIGPASQVQLSLWKAIQNLIHIAMTRNSPD